MEDVTLEAHIDNLLYEFEDYKEAVHSGHSVSKDGKFGPSFVPKVVHHFIEGPVDQQVVYGDSLVRDLMGSGTKMFKSETCSMGNKILSWRFLTSS